MRANKMQKSISDDSFPPLLRHHFPCSHFPPQVLVRPSFVLSGAAMRVASTDLELSNCLAGVCLVPTLTP
jgi:hypothetical protein